MEASFERLVQAQRELEAASFGAAVWGAGYLLDLVREEALAGCGPEVAEQLEVSMALDWEASREVIRLDGVRISLFVCEASAPIETEPELLADPDLVKRAAAQARWLIESVKLAYRIAIGKASLPTLVVKKTNGDIAFEDGLLCLRCRLSR